MESRSQVGADAWIPVFTGMTGGHTRAWRGSRPRHSRRTPSFVKTPRIAPVIPATPRHSCPPCHSRENGNPRVRPRHSRPHPVIPATLATPRPFPLPRESFTRPRCTGPPIPAHIDRFQSTQFSMPRVPFLESPLPGDRAVHGLMCLAPNEPVKTILLRKSFHGNDVLVLPDPLRPSS